MLFNIFEDDLQSLAFVFGYAVGKMSFNYMGLPEIFLRRHPLPS
jgi:hypothetical protein